MNISQKAIPKTTLQIVARSFFKETTDYGFSKIDYLRFVNLLLEMSFKNDVTVVKGQIPKLRRKS